MVSLTKEIVLGNKATSISHEYGTLSDAQADMKTEYETIKDTMERQGNTPEASIDSMNAKLIFGKDMVETWTISTK